MFTSTYTAPPALEMVATEENAGKQSAYGTLLYEFDEIDSCFEKKTPCWGSVASIRLYENILVVERSTASPPHWTFRPFPSTDSGA